MTGIVDVIGEVVVQLLTKLVHSAQDADGRLSVLGYRLAHRAEVVLVKDGGAVGPCEQVDWYGEVLALSIGVVTPGHGADEIERRVAADELDRFGP